MRLPGWYSHYLLCELVEVWLCVKPNSEVRLVLKLRSSDYLLDFVLHASHTTWSLRKEANMSTKLSWLLPYGKEWEFLPRVNTKEQSIHCSFAEGEKFSPQKIWKENAAAAVRQGGWEAESLGANLLLRWRAILMDTYELWCWEIRTRVRMQEDYHSPLFLPESGIERSKCIDKLWQNYNTICCEKKREIDHVQGHKVKLNGEWSKSQLCNDYEKLRVDMYRGLNCELV